MMWKALSGKLALLLFAQTASAEDQFATSTLGFPVFGDTIISTFLVSGEPESIEGASRVYGSLFSGEFGEFNVNVEVDSEVIENFKFPDDVTVSAGGQSIAVNTQQLQSNEGGFTTYLVRVNADPPYSVVVIDDPSPYLGLLVLAAIPYATCGAQEIWNRIGSCEPGSSVTFKLGIASCTVTCGGE